MRLKALLFLVLVRFLSVASVSAQESISNSHEILKCTPLKLIPVSGSKDASLSLDLKDAAVDVTASSVTRDFEIPGTDMKVAIMLRYLPKKIEISKTFFKKSGKDWKLMMSFVSPTDLDLPVPVGTIFVIKTGEAGSSIPPFETECQVSKVKVDRNCATCR